MLNDLLPNSHRLGGASTSSPRVLHCLWSGETGGAERALYQLVREQLAAGEVAPAVLFARGEGQYWDRMNSLGCPTFSVDLPHAYAFHRLRAVSAMMRPYDLLHFHSAEPLLMVASTRWKNQRRVYTHRGGGMYGQSAKKRLRYQATGALLRHRFHAFSGNTAHATRCASDLFGIDVSRFQVTYNGIEFDLLRPTRSAAEVRATLGLDADCFVLGTAAILKPWKRVHRLLEAMAALPRPEMRLLIVGDGEERLALQERAERLGVQSRTIFAGLTRDVADMLQVMDAFCLPSSALESFGNAAVEAMGSGIPTIVFSDSSGIVEHIDPDRTGFVVDDNSQLCEVLLRLLDDRDLAASVGAAGSAAVRARYTPAEAARRYQRLYAAAMG